MLCVKSQSNSRFNRIRKINIMTTIVLIAAGLLCFGLFFKSINFFEKI